MGLRGRKMGGGADDFTSYQAFDEDSSDDCPFLFAVPMAKHL